MTENVPRPNPLRTAGALFAGFAVIVVLSTVTDLVLMVGGTSARPRG